MRLAWVDMAGRSYPPLIRWLLWVGVAVAAVVLYGTVGYVLLERWSISDAFYMTVITMTTVGFREVRDLDTSGRLFTVTVAVLGAGAALTSIALLAAAIVEAELAGLARRRRMTKRIVALRDHFIVCAYGRVGRAAVRELRAAGAAFIVIDPKEELAERMVRDDVTFLIDDPSAEGVLPRAGIATARGIICAVDSDATNVFIVLAARSLNPNLFIVARASEPGSRESLERAGADRVVSPYASSGRHMVRMALDPTIVDPLDESAKNRGSIDIEEHTIGPSSSLIGTTVRESGAPILAIRRAAGNVVPSPSPDTVLADGDVLLLLREDGGS